MALACAGHALVVPAVAAAQERQLISTSLVECGVIHEELAELGAARGRPASDVSDVREASFLFFEAALRQARTEGVVDRHRHLSLVHEKKSEKWRGRFSRLLAFRENLDWIEYCRSLGLSRGVLPVPDQGG